MRLDGFAEHMRSGKDYTTPQGHAWWGPAGWLARRSFWYHLRVFGVVLRGGCIARCGFYNDRYWRSQSYAVLRIVEAAGIPVTITGVANLASISGPVVYVANHMSIGETMLLPSILVNWRHVCFVVKRSLLTYPVFGPLMRAVRPIAVNRVNPREDFVAVMTQGSEALRDGHSVVVFPQATRSLVFRPAQFNSLGVKLAQRAGVPIVPIAIKTDYLPPGRWVRDLGPVDATRDVRLAVGPAFDVGGDAKGAHERVVAFITGHLRAWGIRVEEADADGDAKPEAS